VYRQRADHFVRYGRWVAGNRRQMAIRDVDTDGGANQGIGAGGALCLGRWQTVLWYQGRSRVVPEWYQVGKGARDAFLSSANAYVSHPRAISMRPTSHLEAPWQPTGPATPSRLAHV
jgi:hypothetical protein